MSVRVMSSIWEIPMPPTDKLVLLALADCADDQGNCWPSIATVARKSGVSERSVQRAIRKAQADGLIKRDEVIGKGCKYLITPRHSVTPDNVAPVTGATQTPDTVSPKPSRNTNTQKTASSSLKRATRILPDFTPTLSGKTKSVVDGWPPGRLEDEIEHFIDHHTAKGTLSHDWQASFRTWVKNSNKWEPHRGRHQSDLQQADPVRGQRRSAALDLWLNADAEERAAGHQETGSRAWPAIPAGCPG